MPHLKKYDYTNSILEKVIEVPISFCKDLLLATNDLLPFEIEQFTNWLDYFTNSKPELKPCLIIVN
jgi:hypothetical protein